MFVQSFLRNKLFHSFYWSHNFKIESDEEHDEMMQDLEEMHERLFHAYQITRAMAEAMMNLIMKVTPKNA